MFSLDATCASCRASAKNPRPGCGLCGAPWGPWPWRAFEMWCTTWARRPLVAQREDEGLEEELALVDGVRRAELCEAVRHGLAPLRGAWLLELGRHLFGVRAIVRVLSRRPMTLWASRTQSVCALLAVFRNAAICDNHGGLCRWRAGMPETRANVLAGALKLAPGSIFCIFTCGFWLFGRGFYGDRRCCYTP